MKNPLGELKMECGVGGTGCGTCLGIEAQDVAKRIEHGLHDARVAVFARAEDGKIMAERLLKRCRHAVEDGVYEASHRVKQQPFRFLAIAFAVGALAGFASARSARPDWNAGRSPRGRKERRLGSRARSSL